MKTKAYTYPSASALATIHAWQWYPEDGNVKAVLLLHHGMAEHCGRYGDFLQAFADMGYAVFMHDMLGHGQSCETPEDRGFFGDKDGYNALLQDVRRLYDIARGEYPDKKLVIAGHSMGSFIMRCFTARYPDLDYAAAIYVGTGGPNPLANISVAVTNVLGAVKGKRYRSKWLENTGFKGYNDHFEGRTSVDWLSRDTASVDDYVADDACGFTFTVAAYGDLGRLMLECGSKDWYTRVPKDLPILFVSGQEDPVSNYGAGIRAVSDRLKATGHTRVQVLLYPGARHEILREINSPEVYRDIDAFITKAVLQAK